MREQLIQYVNLLFAGAPDSEEIKQEILQNTLDRYDDLVSQGKTPEAAYRLAITGIGDINEILGSAPQTSGAAPAPVSPAASDHRDAKLRRRRTAAAVAFYILCPMPLIILGELGEGVIGLLLMFLMIAAATAMLIMNAKDNDTPENPAPKKETTPQQELRKSVNGIIWAIGIAAYFILSNLTGAWYITWVIFPLVGSVQGLVRAIMDLKEVNDYEN